MALDPDGGIAFGGWHVLGLLLTDEAGPVRAKVRQESDSGAGQESKADSKADTKATDQ